MTNAEWRPLVSVVVPMLNEARFIDACLDSFAAQTYPLELLDVVVVDGGSTDGSRERVETRAQDCGWLHLVDNPKRKASAAFNEGVLASQGDVVCLFSAHGVADTEYVARSVAVLAETRADGVGGRYIHRGVDPASNAIGAAMVSPFGMASPHRFAKVRQEVDTISHPAYRRTALAGVVPFDEALERNSDYELNWRLRQAGGHLVFDPTVVSVYRPRGSLFALARQFWWYGRWKARVIRRHPDSLRLRHVAAPVAVSLAALGAVLAWSRPVRRIGLVLGAMYGALTISAVVRAHPRRLGADPFILTAAFPVMHGAWGSGFVFSLIEDGLSR